MSMEVKIGIDHNTERFSRGDVLMAGGLRLEFAARGSILVPKTHVTLRRGNLAWIVPLSEVDRHAENPHNL